MKIQTAVKKLATVAASVFTLLAGLKLWLSTQGLEQFFALFMILVGTVALEHNISVMIKRRRDTSESETRYPKSNQAN